VRIFPSRVKTLPSQRPRKQEMEMKRPGDAPGSEWKKLLTLSVIVALLAGCTFETIKSRPVATWPYWAKDIRVKGAGKETLWKAAFSTIATRYPIDVSDKDRNFIRTKWVKSKYFREWRFTVVLIPAESRVRVGIEVRDQYTRRYAKKIYIQQEMVLDAITDEIRRKIKAALRP